MSHSSRKARGVRKDSKRRKAAARPKNDVWKLLYQSVLALPLPPLARQVALGALRARDLKRLDQLVEANIPDTVYRNSSEEYLAFASLKALYSKLEVLTSPDGEAKALATWHKAERVCSRANRRLALTTRGLVGKQYLPVLEKAREIVHRVLGEFNFAEFAQNCRHGPGVAIGLAGLATSGAFKYASSVYTVSPSCAQLFRDLVITDQTWFNAITKHQTQLNIVEDADKLAFVPKNWKTKRTIGIGPIGNLFCQLGIGEMMSNRLKRAGIDIHDQTNNQKAALAASLQEGTYGDDYVTLDLSMASDTVNREIVKFLVPDTWYRVLDCTRVRWTYLPDGSRVWLSKFSAMGNGFTFPLETLVFYSLSLACMADTVHRNRVWVYGDDIIVPRGSSLWLSEVLRWCGFVVNTDKSFFHGSFYESCGADYLGGVSVRPVYWKHGVDDPRHLNTVVNGYRRLALQSPACLWIHDLRRVLLSHYHQPVLYGPPQSLFTRVKGKRGTAVEEQFLEDRVEEEDSSLWRMRRIDSVLQCKVYKTAPKRELVDDDFAYLQARHGLSSCGDERSPNLLEDATPPTSEPVKGTFAHSMAIRMVSYGTRWISVS